MKKELYEFNSYKNYLKEWLKSQEKGGRGLKSALAQAMGCQTAYVSQVLNGEAQFSLEQGEILNRYFNHNKEEADFFFLLIQHERAGSQNLREYFYEKISEVGKRRLHVKERLSIKKTMNELDHARYYSAWYYAAAHILLSIPGHDTRTAIAKRLGLGMKKTTEILDFLVDTGLAMQEGDHYRLGKGRTHLGNDSPEIIKHHSNWRMRAVQSLDRETMQELHYSSVTSLSKEDILQIKEIFLKTIQSLEPIVSESPEEELYCLCLDWFAV